MKKLLCEIINRHKNEMIHMGNDIFKNPELGFKELHTSARMTTYLKNMGLHVQNNKN